MIDHVYWMQQAKDLMKETLNQMQTKMNKDKNYHTLTNTFDRR
jgi:hypothetical protein